jgi:hypothetical protein
LLKEGIPAPHMASDAKHKGRIFDKKEGEDGSARFQANTEFAL